MRNKAVCADIGHVNCESEIFAMTISAILLIVLLIAALTALPRWPYSVEWGYGPSGLLGAAVLLLIVFALLDHAPI